MWKYIRVIFGSGFKILWAYFAWMLRYSKNPKKYPIELRYKRIKRLVLSVLKNFKVDIHKFNQDSVITSKHENTLIVCNHESLLDPLIFIALSEKPVTFACKEELRKVPFVKRVVSILEGEYLNRSDLKQQLRTMQKIQEKLKNIPNLDWVIFPEGTRNKNPYEGALEFHHGTFRCATKSNSDILICSLFNSFQVLSLKTGSKKFDIYFHYLKRITPEEYKNSSTSEIAIDARNLVNFTIKNDVKNIKVTNVDRT